MLLQYIVAALGLSLSWETLGSPFHGDKSRAKRDISATHVLHERHTPHVARRWTKLAKVPDNVLLPMRIGLKQRNLDAGQDRLIEISDPSSSQYGKHMTAEQVIDFFSPEQSTVDAVMKWLENAGISASRIGQSFNRQWIQFDVLVREAENLLFASFYTWEHESGEHQDIACEEYHVPLEVREHIDYITPGVRLRQSGKSKRQNSQKKRSLPYSRQPKIFATPGKPYPGHNSTSCDFYITADCIRAQYGIPNGTTAAAGNELGIFESLTDHYSKGDLDLFFKDAYPGLIPPGTYPENRLIDGAIGSAEDVAALLHTEFNPGGESNLDFQASWPLIWPQKTVLFQTDDEYYENLTANANVGFLNTFLDAIDGSYCTYSAYGETGDCAEGLCQDPSYPDPNGPSPYAYKGMLQCGKYKPTNVISISYGGYEVSLPDAYQKRQCNEYMKLGLQGITVVVSSGDSGVGTGGDCLGPCIGTDEDCIGNIFVPDFPVTCPYILAVGSTELDRVDPAAPKVPYEKLVEVATKRFPSGGGFSNIYGVPSYQRKAVQAYYDQVEASLPFTGYHRIIKDGDFSGIRPDQLYHHGGRGYPDVSMVGDRQLVALGGLFYRIGGTSLSAPLWGAVLTLINEKRIAAGKNTLGFIHPLLYAHPEAFNDVTGGANPACNSTGFPAAKGWDPVTGLGSPNYPTLEAVLLTA